MADLNILLFWVCLVSFGNGEKPRKGAVVTNGQGCSDIGASILEQGGNAVDSAIATLFCEGAAMPQGMGLGGGFVLTLFNKSTGELWTMNAREVAPAKAYRDMYLDDPDKSKWGGKAVAVPGELRGYWYLYKKFGGKLPWRKLVEPTIKLCLAGIEVTAFLADKYRRRKNLLYKDPVLRSIFINPITNDTYKTGEYIKLYKLANTLKIIAEEGGDALHDGSLTRRFVKDIQKRGGILTEADMQNYQPIWAKPIAVSLKNNETVFTPPLPASGIVLALILNTLNNYISLDFDNVTITQRIVETFKFTHGRRGEFGDPRYWNMTQVVRDFTSKQYAMKIRSLISDTRTYEDPEHYKAKFMFTEDHGTAHISVLSSEGDAVSVTSTINLLFGAGFASESTGIILNDEMRDFSSPNLTNGNGFFPSPMNFVGPGKRPITSMCPSIVLDGNKDVIMTVGAAGGSKIPTAVSWVIMRHLWLGMDLQTAINSYRFHHQLFPNLLHFDPEFETEYKHIVNALAAMGHKYNFQDDQGFGAVTAISRKSGQIVACADKRRNGSVTYVY